MDWELLIRIRPLFAGTGAAALLGLFAVIVFLFVAAIKETITRGRGA